VCHIIVAISVACAAINFEVLHQGFILRHLLFQVGFIQVDHTSWKHMGVVGNAQREDKL